MSQRTDTRAPASAGSTGPRGGRPWRRLLPREVDGRVRALAVASLVAQIVLVGTGGAVRLTDSGLGCPTWPRCTASSLVTTPAMGGHGVIEFVNRTLTGVLLVIVVATLLSVVRLARTHPALVRLAALLVAGIPVQAVIGGISVLVKLNPYVVGLHFLVSMALVALSALYVAWTRRVPGPRVAVVPPWFRIAGAALGVVVAITVALGILTTGSGPHAGDADTPRNGLDPALMQHLHSLPAYATAGITLLMLGASLSMTGAGVTRWLAGLTAIEVAQIAVGLAQANLGLPAGLVIAHMVLASLLVATTVGVLVHLTRAVQRTPVQVEPL